ncbi:HipA domain-containing protein [Cellulomonas fimi]|uniref:HipA domain-containing protein n=1 Tax=Cellulomonas fimi TaxID=1708 RepID=UPI0002E69CD1|nr:HipA domain-containing protein [Cellulomonas fimi]NNH05504.1 type II toxin-antitoxin system HipA family toxin [Cellulomonas fimi]VEH36453.1 Serine/threonine-protein kinase HipA [Cellulomonas fimi]
MTDEDVATELGRTIVAYRTGQPYASTWGRISLAGAQPKLGLVRAGDGSWHMPGRGVPTTHIVKPELTAPGERYPDLTIVEAFGLAVAGHAGLRVPRWSIWTSPDESIRALVVERYDRRLDEDGVVRRLHQEDLCQALGVPPALTYQRQDGGPGVGQIGELLRFRVPHPDAALAAREFLAGLTFNIAFLNTDAHAKNYSVMLSGAHVEMSPLYDLTTYALYTDNDDERPLDFPMHVGGDYRFRSILPGAIVQEGKRLGLREDEAADVVHDVVARLPGAFDLARQDLAAVPDGERVTDTVVANLPKLSPLYGAAVGSPAIIDLSPHR